MASSLAHSLDLKIEEKLTSDFDFKGYIITNDMTESQIEHAYRLLINALQPADDRTIAKELLKLRAITSHRNDGGDIDIIIETFVEKLRDYPSDSVLKGLKRIGDKSKWFPSWSEIKDEVDYQSRHRRALMSALERKRDEKRYAFLRQIK